MNSPRVIELFYVDLWITVVHYDDDDDVDYYDYTNIIIETNYLSLLRKYKLVLHMVSPSGL